LFKEKSVFTTDFMNYVRSRLAGGMTQAVHYCRTHVALGAYWSIFGGRTQAPWEKYPSGMHDREHPRGYRRPRVGLLDIVECDIIPIG
jgi:hypothetical protein